MNFTKVFGVVALLVVAFVYAERTKEARVMEEQARFKHAAEVRPELAGKMADAVLKEARKSEQAKEATVDAKALEKIIKGGLNSKNLDNAVRLVGNLAGRLNLETSITVRDPELQKLIKSNQAQEKAIEAKVAADMKMYDQLSQQADQVGKKFKDEGTVEKLQAGIKHTILSNKGEQGTKELLTTSGNLLRKLSGDEANPAAQQNLMLLERMLNTPASQGVKAKFASMLKGALFLKGINKEQAAAETAAKAYTTVTEEYAKGLLEQFRDLGKVTGGKDIKKMSAEEVAKELNTLEETLMDNGKLTDASMKIAEDKALDSLNRFLMEKLGIKTLEELEKVKKECCLMAPCNVSGLAGKNVGDVNRNLAKPDEKNH